LLTLNETPVRKRSREAAAPAAHGSVNRIVFADSAIMIRLHPKPADLNEAMIQAATRARLTRRGSRGHYRFWPKNYWVNC
jgi:hypothetical protein